MPLLNLKTNLKDIKYGQDQPGGGDSRQPYIKTDINTVDTGFNRLRLTKFDDGLIRGGVIGALNSSVVDTLRIGKFFLDFPKGPLFIVKQIGLQLTNPRLEVPKNIANIAAGAPSNVLSVGTNGLLQPTRIYNLGVNTLLQVPLNAFGGHIIRHGLLPIQSDASKYEAIVTANNDSFNLNDPSKNNRLVSLSRKFQLGDRVINRTIGTTANTINQITSAINALTGTSIPQLNGPIDTVIDDYLGGPGSVYGIGRTLIKRYSNTEDGFRINLANQFSNQFAGKTRNSTGNPESVKIKNTKDFAVSTTSRSTLNSNGWTYNDGISLDNSFLNTIAKDADKNGINVVNQKNSYNDANTRAKNGFFYGVSNYSSSIYVSGSLKDNSGISSTLDYTISSIKDTQSGSYSNTYAGNSRDSTGAPIINSKVIRDNNVGLGVSKQYFFSGSSAGPIDYPRPFDKTTYPKSIDVQLDVVSNQVTRTPDVVISPSDSAKNASYQKYQDIIDSRKLGGITYYDKNKNEVNAFGIYGVGLNVPSFTNNILPNSTGNIVYYNGNSLLTINKAFTWSNITRELRVGSGRQDEINLTPIFTENAHFAGDTASGKNIRDLVKFRIQAVNTDGPDSGRWMVFRAYITNLSDDTTPEWTDVKYAGRGDKFYIYNGFTRKINVTFQVAALSEGEMRFIYQKLNFLMGNAMPDYNNNLMRGPLVRMSIGNWIDCQLGKLDSVSLKPVQDSPWEIALDEPEAGTKQLILPHVVEVTLGFTPIGSETRGTNLISEKSETTSHIAQNNTGADADTLQYIK
jgi:hypothetical protein